MERSQKETKTAKTIEFFRFAFRHKKTKTVGL